MSMSRNDVVTGRQCFVTRGSIALRRFVTRSIIFSYNDRPLFFSFSFENTRSSPCTGILRAVSISFHDGFVRATYHEVGRAREKKKRKGKKAEKEENKGGRTCS